MLHVTVYSKPDCHLCDDALDALAALRARYPHELHRVDITQDTGLLERYRSRIPVFEVGGREYDPPFSRPGLAEMLGAHR